MSRPYPIIYLPDWADQRRLYDLIWTPTNSYGGRSTLARAWSDWHEATVCGYAPDAPCSHCCIFSTGAKISGMAYSADQFRLRRYPSGYLAMNSIRHFADYLKVHHLLRQ